MPGEVKVKISAIDDQARAAIGAVKNQLLGLVDVGPRLKNVFAGIGLGIAGAAGIQTLVKGFREMVDTDKELERSTENLRKAFADIVAGALDYGNTSGQVRDQVERLTAFIKANREEVIAWGNVIVQAVKAALESFGALVRAGWNVGQILGTVFSELGEVILGALTFDSDRIKLSWGRLSDALKGDINDIVAGFMRVKTAVVDVGKAMDEALAGGKPVLGRVDVSGIKVPDVKGGGLTDINEMLKNAEKLQKILDGFTTSITTEQERKSFEAGRKIIDDYMKTLEEKKKELKKNVLELTATVRESVATSIVSISETIGNLISSAARGFDNFGKALLAALGNIMKQVGTAMIAFGTAGLAIRNFILNPLTAIVAGAALVVLGSALSSAAQNAMNGAGDASQGSGASKAGSSGKPIDVNVTNPEEIGRNQRSGPDRISINIIDEAGNNLRQILYDARRRTNLDGIDRIPYQIPAAG